VIDSNSLSRYLLPDRRSGRVFLKIFPVARLMLGAIVVGVTRYGDQRAEPAPVEGVAQTLLDFPRTHPTFDQFRDLNTQGNEMVRIDAGREGSRIVASDKLQDKSSREYFERAVELPKGRVIVLPVEFNKERGAIDQAIAG
jgi:hypothetical protein